MKSNITSKGSIKNKDIELYIIISNGYKLTTSVSLTYQSMYHEVKLKC